MTYIIGTNFNVYKKVIKPGMSSNNAGGVGVLPPGQYTINYIKVTNEGVIYTFVNENLTPINITFKSTAQADEYISAMRNEKLPNYTEVYRRLA